MEEAEEAEAGSPWAKIKDTKGLNHLTIAVLTAAKRNLAFTERALPRKETLGWAQG